MEPVFILIVVVFLVLFVLGAIHSHRAAKQRREALAALALERGWRFLPENDHSHDDQFGHFSVFKTGSSRYAYNSLLGSLEIEGIAYTSKAGDYHYTTTSSDKDGKTTTHHHHFSYLLIDLPLTKVPALKVRPEGMFDKLGAFFGFDDIDFESAEFSRRFHVTSSDKRFAYDVIHPRMMEFLLATRGPTIDIDQGQLCLTTGAVWKPEEFGPYLEWTELFFQRWPRHVIAERS